MHRLLPTLATCLCLAVAAPAYAQRAPGAPAAASNAKDSRPQVLPADPIPLPHSTQVRLPGFYGGAAEIQADPLGETEILQRISRIYSYQSQILSAQAAGDSELAEGLLDLAMTELSTLVQQPDITQHSRFGELYRTVLGEYERYYGVSADTLTLAFGDIFQFRADMFAALNDVDMPLLEDVFPSHAQPIRTTIPMTQNRLVEQSISYLKRSPEKHLYHWLSRAETYFPMIEQIFREEGVPDELKYLAMIESGLNPRAASWAQAGGMWQFITATGRAYDLQVNGWVDERMDPEKATRAAARHLRDLHKMFGGDWQLALAGYNCSPSRIRRAISRAESRLGRRATFWDIYDDIPKETRNYVPMFIAAALVASNPEAFDIDQSRVKSGPRYSYHYVPVHGMLALETIANLAGTDVSTLRALNPELRRGHVPPSRSAYYIRLPIGTLDRFTSAYANLPKEARQSATEYVVRRGDSLGKIATKYGVTVSNLMRTNDLRSTTIRPGQQLIVPVPAYDSSPVLAEVRDTGALTVDYGHRTVRPVAMGDAVRTASGPSQPTPPVVRANSTTSAAPRTAEPATASKSSETRVVYTVRRGDNLTTIASKYGATVAEIKRWNNLSSNGIQTGQRLYLYETGEARAPTETSRTVYLVRRGDTLGKVARNHGVSIADLRRWNNIKGSTIRVGQRLDIHGGKPPIVSYKVRRGDTLIEIARRHGVTVNQIKKWNSLRSNTIRTGQTLKIHS